MSKTPHERRAPWVPMDEYRLMGTDVASVSEPRSRRRAALVAPSRGPEVAARDSR